MAKLVIDTASEIVADTTNFNNELSSSDNTIQKALDTIDNKYNPNLLAYSYFGGF
jgi:hypothetical protein